MIVVVLSVAAVVSAGAQAPAMPLLLLEGNRYSRESLDAQGARTALQSLEVGSLQRIGDDLEVTVLVRNIDGTDTLAEPVRTTIRCRVRDSDMVMNVLALLGGDGRRVRLVVTGGDILYPTAPPDGPLSPVTLEARLQEGALGFFRGRSKIVLRDRVVARSTEADEGFTISARLDLKFYVLGVRVRSNTYRSTEIIAPTRGLVRQLLTAADESSVSITLLG